VRSGESQLDSAKWKYLEHEQLQSVGNFSITGRSFCEVAPLLALSVDWQKSRYREVILILIYEAKRRHE
jgi:hypothetical protein